MKELRKKIERACPEFLNQEIGLAEVLRTIDMFSNEAVVLSTDGRFGNIKDIYREGFSGKPRWNLSSDLDGQGEEIISYLNKIITHDN